jgi:hypothetical protein
MGLWKLEGKGFEPPNPPYPRHYIGLVLGKNQRSCGVVFGRRHEDSAQCIIVPADFYHVRDKGERWVKTKNLLGETSAKEK